MCILPGWTLAQSNDDFNPTLPAEPGQLARVVVSVSPVEAGSASGGGTYKVGASQRISTSSAGAQWKFKQWRNAATNAVVSTSTSFYYTTVWGTTKLVAEYEELPVTSLTLECEPKEANASLSGAGDYVQGVSCSVTAYNPTGFTFSHWTDKRTGARLSTSRSFNFTKSGVKDTLVAHYNFTSSMPIEPTKPADPIIYHKVTVTQNIAEGGSTSIKETQVQVGKTLTVSAYNNTHYAFLGWMQGSELVSQNSTYTLTMGNNDIKLEALFDFAPGTPKEPEGTVIDPVGPIEPEPEDPEHEGPSTLLGDVNGDWKIDYTDATYIKEYINGNVLPGFVLENADVKPDGRINAADFGHIHYLINHPDEQKRR